ncbi:MAG: DUF2585 family protein [Alphaproteobacteria bacterium]|nr:DUF2585 family protein [Alphaproteobacteria bacterium]
MAKALPVIAIVLAVQATTLYLLGQPLICACGYVTLFVSDVWSAQMSQQLTDWYSFSHIIHGFIFYGLLHLIAPRLPVPWRLAIAVGIEATWEIAENTPWVIQAYRHQALAQGYVGDSILNSLMDNVSMMLGFVLAWKLPWKVTVALAIAMEVGVAWAIHDNLTLNILGFFHQFDFITAWQSRK